MRLRNSAMIERGGGGGEAAASRQRRRLRIIAMVDANQGVDALVSLGECASVQERRPYSLQLPQCCVNWLIVNVLCLTYVCIYHILVIGIRTLWLYTRVMCVYLDLPSLFMGGGTGVKEGLRNLWRV